MTVTFLFLSIFIFHERQSVGALVALERTRAQFTIFLYCIPGGSCERHYGDKATMPGHEFTVSQDGQTPLLTHTRTTVTKKSNDEKRRQMELDLSHWQEVLRAKELGGDCSQVLDLAREEVAAIELELQQNNDEKTKIMLDCRLDSANSRANVYGDAEKLSLQEIRAMIRKRQEDLCGWPEYCIAEEKTSRHVPIDLGSFFVVQLDEERDVAFCIFKGGKAFSRVEPPAFAPPRLIWVLGESRVSYHNVTR